MSSTELTVLLAAITALIGAISKFVLDMYKLRQDMKTMSENVQKIEVATNSMKDALVAAALDKGRLEGAETEREEQIIKDAKGSKEDPIHVELKDKENDA